MPLQCRIDHRRRLVVAVGYGTLTDSDVFGYQRIIWGQPDVSGYDELVDVTRVVQFELPSAERVRDLAELAAEMDAPLVRSKFAIVAASEVAFELGREFQAYRRRMERSAKEVELFRTLESALAFLGMEDLSWVLDDEDPAE
jgi:hypothetical protein